MYCIAKAHDLEMEENHKSHLHRGESMNLNISEVQTKLQTQWKLQHCSNVHQLDFAISPLKTARIVTTQYLTLNDWFRGEQ